MMPPRRYYDTRHAATPPMFYFDMLSICQERRCRAAARYVHDAAPLFMRTARDDARRDMRALMLNRTMLIAMAQPNDDTVTPSFTSRDSPRALLMFALFFFR